MNSEQKYRLLQETRETADRLNKLNTFMAGDVLPTLEREDKDLLYSQQRIMSEYVQILGKRLERAGQQFTHVDTCKWKMSSEMWICLNPHDGNPLCVKGLTLCPVCGQKMELIP